MFLALPQFRFPLCVSITVRIISAQTHREEKQILPPCPAQPQTVLFLCHGKIGSVQSGVGVGAGRNMAL